MKRLGAKFYEELNGVKHLCAHMDISLDFKEQQFCTITNVTFIESTVYFSYIVPSTEPRLFSGEGGRRLFEGGRLFQIFRLRRGTNSKRALIWSWALIRAFTVIGILCQGFAFFDLEEGKNTGN